MSQCFTVLYNEFFFALCGCNNATLCSYSELVQCVDVERSVTLSSTGSLNMCTSVHCRAPREALTWPRTHSKNQTYTAPAISLFLFGFPNIFLKDLNGYLLHRKPNLHCSLLLLTFLFGILAQLCFSISLFLNLMSLVVFLLPFYHQQFIIRRRTN